jgi:NAD(P)-dependent dehydrogenase (short-subunit alcohol dehydrogenase family)
MTDLAGKTVLITGAGGGFGREMVRQFRSAGATLLLTDVSEDALRDVIGAAGSDLADPGQQRRHSRCGPARPCPA